MGVPEYFIRLERWLLIACRYAGCTVSNALGKKQHPGRDPLCCVDPVLAVLCKKLVTRVSPAETGVLEGIVDAALCHAIRRICVLYALRPALLLGNGRCESRQDPYQLMSMQSGNKHKHVVRLLDSGKCSSQGSCSQSIASR